MYTRRPTKNAGLKYAEFGRAFSLFIEALTYMYAIVAAAAIAAALIGSRK
jgi:hypothetical protein